MPLRECRRDPTGHCCWVNGTLCKFFRVEDGLAVCSIWDQMDTDEWWTSPMGRQFAEESPGYTCRDWPQNIPQVMATGIGLCCWAEP